MSRDVTGALTAALGNLFAWVSHSEQIWFPMLGAYVEFVAPNYALPDLRGPFAFATLLYVGLRLGDLWQEHEDIEESL